MERIIGEGSGGLEARRRTDGSASLDSRGTSPDLRNDKNSVRLAGTWKRNKMTTGATISKNADRAPSHAVLSNRWTGDRVFFFTGFVLFFVSFLRASFPLDIAYRLPPPLRFCDAPEKNEIKGRRFRYFFRPFFSSTHIRPVQYHTCTSLPLTHNWVPIRGISGKTLALTKSHTNLKVL